MWKDIVIPFGKHKGWTMFQIYVNDYSYLLWIVKQDINSFPAVIFKAAQDAIAHKEAVDPYSKSDGGLDFSHRERGDVKSTWVNRG